MGSSFALELRRERRQASRDNLNDERELRRAARLVHEELREALWTIEHAVDHHAWWPHPSRKFETQRWHDFAPVFAGSNDITEEQWSFLVFAYEDLRSQETDLDAFFRSEATLPPFDVEGDQMLRWLWETVNEGRQAIAELAGQAIERSGFDGVAAMWWAAERAAKQLMPVTGSPTHPAPIDRSRFEVQESTVVTGIALVGAPNWRQFTARLSPGRVLTITVPEIGGSSACVMSTLGPRRRGSEHANVLVPEDVRNDENFEDFAFLVDEEQRRRWFKELASDREA